MKYLDYVGLTYFFEKLKSIIGSYVAAEDPVSITDTIPPTFDGYLSSDFALKTELVEQESDLVSHANDVSLHVTSTERNTWNNMLPKSGGTMTGRLVVQSDSAYSVAQTRNIIVSVADIGNGGALANGTIYLVYE